MRGIVVGADHVARCSWCAGDPLYEQYHDREWGRPVAEGRRLFEKLSLEGFQAGLSWLTILRKRENFRVAFEAFEAESVARFDARDIERLMADAGIVRNRAKIQATINNARRVLNMEAEVGSLAHYVWSFEPETPLHHVTVSPEAKAMSNDLRRRGWSFVGPTMIHSFMQATGLINDHADECDFRPEIERERASFQRPR